MTSEVRQVMIGGTRIGIVGLGEILKELESRGLTSDEERRRVLLEKVKAKNYVPPGWEERYAQALLEEYKVYSGEIEERRHEVPMEVKVLGPGCTNCQRLERLTMEVLEELGLAVDFEHVRNFIQIAEYGVMATPALMVNGQVVFSGMVPSKAELMSILSRFAN